MTRSSSHLKALAATCILGAALAAGAPPASAQQAEPPPAVQDCEQAKNEVESLRSSLAKAIKEVAAKESQVKKLSRAAKRTSSKAKKRKLKRKLKVARGLRDQAIDDKLQYEEQLKAAREKLGSVLT